MFRIDETALPHDGQYGVWVHDTKGKKVLAVLADTPEKAKERARSIVGLLRETLAPNPHLEF